MEQHVQKGRQDTRQGDNSGAKRKQTDNLIQTDMNFNTNKRPTTFLENINGTWVIETPNGLLRNSGGVVRTFTDETLDEARELIRTLRNQ